MHDGAIHTSTNYGANTYSLEVFRWLEPNDSHELPALIDFYAYGTTQFATFGLARLVHKGTKTDTDAQVLLADAKRMGVVTQTGKLARKAPTKAHISERFGEGIDAMFGARENEVLNHPRYRLHVLTSRGRHLLRRDTRVRSPLGYAGAFFTNVVSRKAMSAWIEAEYGRFEEARAQVRRGLAIDPADEDCLRAAAALNRAIP